MDLSGLLVAAGATAQASGRVQVADGETWFERPGPMPLPHPARPLPRGRYAIRAHGVDLTALDATGWATLTGVWSGHELHVRQQGPRIERTNRGDKWRTPPCPTPPQGWPLLDAYGNVPGRPPQPDEWPALTITAVTVFRVDATHGVYVVAAEDPDLAAQRLGDMCVVRSRYTREQLERTGRRLHEEMESYRWPITAHGDTSSVDGQPLRNAQLAWVPPDMVEWAAALPDGILDLDVWLTPFGRSSPTPGSPG